MSQLLNQYVKDCLRTESQLTTLEINDEVVAKLFGMFEDLTEVLDGLKKYTFYNKSDKFLKEFYVRLDRINVTSGALLNKKSNEVADRSATILNPRMFHGILGIMTETGELSQIWSKHQATGEAFDAVHVQEELGDQHWYHSIINSELQIDPEATLDKNIRKLKKRFPDKYSHDYAGNRNLEAERQELEN